MIAVTGGNGFLGRHVLTALRNRDFNYTVLSRLPLLLEGVPKEKIRVVNFKDPPGLEKALEGASQILHLAGRVNGSVGNLKEANAVLMQRLVGASRCIGVKKIIYMSSVAAHTRKGPYGKSKWQAEEMLKSSGIPYLIFRAALLYGQGDNKNVATMQRVIKKFPVFPLLGGGGFLLQPLYVEDAVSVLTRALESPFENRIYHLAGPSQISLKDMAVIMADSCGRRIKFYSVPLRPLQVFARLWSAVFPNTRLPVKQILELDQHSAFNIEEARRDFGFSPRNFRDGIQTMKGTEALCVG